MIDFSFLDSNSLVGSREGGSGGKVSGTLRLFRNCFRLPSLLLLCVRVGISILCKLCVCVCVCVLSASFGFFDGWLMVVRLLSHPSLDGIYRLFIRY